MLRDPALIEAPRLRFRFLSRDDAPAWEEFLSYREAVKYFPPFDEVKQFSIDWMERALTRYHSEGLGLYALIEKSSGAFVGQCGFVKQEVDGALETEIGYHLIPRFWKYGFATEAAMACRNYAFRNNLADSIISIIDKRNQPSIQVAMRNGMKPDKETVWRSIPVFIYRITKEQWLRLNR
jgi:RimJ/RimL family protein N-acetyltransferase